MLSEATATSRPPALAGALRVKITGGLEEVRRVNDSIARFLWERQVAPDRLHDVQLVVEELVTNVLRHGGTTGRRPTIAVEVEILDEGLRLVVEDDGRFFDPTALPETPLPAHLEDRRPGGLGLRIVRRLVTRLAYRRLLAGNRVEALIPLASPPDIAE